MSRSRAGEEYRIDPAVDPPGQLDGRTLFLEMEATVGVGDGPAGHVERSLGSLLMHLPPNPWSPLMKASFRELRAHPDARFRGTVTRPAGANPVAEIEWGLLSLQRVPGGRSVTLRAGACLDLPDRPSALRTLDQLSAAAAPGSGVVWPGSVALPTEPSPTPVSCRPLRVIDALDQVSLSAPDDPDDETYTICRQRHWYGSTPVLIELWGFGDYVGRTWVMLAEDISSRFGGVDLEAAKGLIAGDLRPGSGLRVRVGGPHVRMTEI
jgi:hypothetical protein